MTSQTQEGETQEPDEPVETRIEVEIPRINVDLGNATHFVKVPNFLTIDQRCAPPSFLPITV